MEFFNQHLLVWRPYGGPEAIRGTQVGRLLAAGVIEHIGDDLANSGTAWPPDALARYVGKGNVLYKLGHDFDYADYKLARQTLHARDAAAKRDHVLDALREEE